MSKETECILCSTQDKRINLKFVSSFFVYIHHFFFLYIDHLPCHVDILEWGTRPLAYLISICISGYAELHPSLPFMAYVENAIFFSS